MLAFILLLILPVILISIEFLGFLIKGKHIINVIVLKFMEIFALIILPLTYAGFGEKNKCCDDNPPAFGYEHQLTMVVFISICLFAYFYSSYRKKIASPLIEIIVNSLLLFGVVLNIFVARHAIEPLLYIAGSVPIILLFVLVLAKNQKLFIQHLHDTNLEGKTALSKLAIKVLRLNPVVKFPLLFILFLPIFILITAILLLFGQKPDSIILAFTQTYKHGFSQLDYQCDNVNCGGHYLCSVAANGHTNIVRPVRRGVRNSNAIICNRQLLVSNAFEDLLQERLPFLHKIIRQQYNRVGNVVHRYYGIFNNKFVSDIIYILMKPLEWLFVIALYTFDRKPENRIAKQYLSIEDRRSIEKEFVP